MLLPRTIGLLGLTGLLLIPATQSWELSQSADVSNSSPQSLNQSEAANVSSAQNWFLKGEAADRAGNKQEAVEAYLEAAKIYHQLIDRNPGVASWWRNLGLIYWLCDKREQAIDAYRNAVRLEPDDAASHHLLGTIQADDLTASIAEFREAVRLKPAEARFHLDLGRALARKNYLNESIAEFQEASRLNPEDGESHALWGAVLVKKGDVEGAVSEYRKALTLALSDSSASRVRRALTEVLARQAPGRRRNAKYWLEKVKEWAMAVAEHNPGKSDPAAVIIGSWALDDLGPAIDLVMSLAPPSVYSSRQAAVVDARIKRELGKLQAPGDAQVRESLGLSDNEVRQGGLNRLLKRGALLHTDIALLGLETGPHHIDERLGVFEDGRVTIQPKNIHWEYARRLLDFIYPLPSEDPIVRQWYIATTAYVQSRRFWVYAEGNLERALEIFPSDYRILFYTGVMHETWASPVHQNSLLPAGADFSFGSMKSELKLARQFFEKAVTANPDFAEAHLHLGRVMGLLGQHEEAVLELQQVAAAMADPQLSYFTSLFLGYELAMLSRSNEARDQYERAAALYPNAQSPLLGLSHVALTGGDTEGASLAVQRVFELRLRDSWRDDPWWAYDSAHVRDASGFIAEMYKAFGELPQ